MSRKDFLTILSTIALLLAICACIVVIKSGMLVIKNNQSPNVKQISSTPAASGTLKVDSESFGNPIDFPFPPSETPIKTFKIASDSIYQECNMFLGYTYKVINESGSDFLITADPEMATVTDKDYVIPQSIGAAVLWTKNSSGDWIGFSIAISEEGSFNYWSYESCNLSKMENLNIGTNIIAVTSSDPDVAYPQLIGDEVHLFMADKVGRCELTISYLLKPSQTIVINNIGVFDDYYNSQYEIAMEMAKRRGIE